MTFRSVLHQQRTSLLVVFFSAFILRVLHVSSILHSPIADTVVLDARYYFTEAGRLLGIFTDLTGVRFMNVGYPYVVAALSAVFGYHVATVLWAQVLFGALTALFIFAAAWMVTENARVSFLSGMAAAVYSASIFYDGLMLTPSVINFILSAAVFCFMAGVKKESPVLMTVSGLFVGLASLIRANSLLLLAVWPVVMMVLQRTKGWKSGRLGIALLAGGIAVVSPVILYNGMVHGEWVAISANGGMNFWVGNHAQANGLYSAPSFVGSQSAESEQEAYLAEARRRSGDSTLTLSGASAFWRSAALTDIASNPLRWGRLLLDKFLMTLNNYEIQTNTAFDFVRRFSPVLVTLPVGFSFLFPLGIAGVLMVLLRIHEELGWIMIAFAGVYLLTNVFFFVSGEYRHPVSIILCIGAGVFVDAALTAVASLRRRLHPPASYDLRSMKTAALIGLIAVPVTLWPTEQVGRISDPFYSYTNYAQAQYRKIQQGHTPSVEEFHRAVQLLRLAQPKPHQQMILWEVLCRTHFFAAVSYGNSAEAKQALVVAQQIFSEDYDSVGGLYDQQFLRFLFSNVPALVREIVKDERFAADPEVRQYAERAHRLFLANTTIHPYLAPLGR